MGLGLKLFNVTNEQVVALAVKSFINPLNDKSKYQQLVDEVNLRYPAAGLNLPPGQVPTAASVVTLISQNANISKVIPDLIFDLYISSADIAISGKRLSTFFNTIAPNGIENYISDLLTPKAKATLTLSAGIEFPTSVLQPVNLDGSVIPNTKTMFKFGEATFYIDTEAGIGTQFEFDGSLIPNYSRIGNTGFIIEIKKAKLDLSQTTNIPKADAAGYPSDFTGLYVQEAMIKVSKYNFCFV